ncbi:MAG: metallophosphoesterase [Syntrophorhabdales bacterium]|jgi:3',5'-cyclic AMP phosphodiesterase CpdA
MPGISYVCLSDTHFGAKNSLLTKLKPASWDTDPEAASSVMQHLVACLRDLLAKAGNPQGVTLILNGDILELALTTDNEAYMVFRRFMELIMSPRLFKTIVYVPGNHDHRLWELARETQYMTYVGRLEASDDLPIPWHTTKMFMENASYPVTSYSLDSIIRKYGFQDLRIAMAYPNFALLQKRNQRCVIFHHGHFVEPLYQLMTTLRSLILAGRRPPVHIWDIEAENSFWIDCFWSFMGRGGDGGKDVQSVYDTMKARDAFKNALYQLVNDLAEKYDVPGWDDITDTRFLQWATGALVHRMRGTEKTLTGSILSDGGRRGLQAYVSGPLKDQIDNECGANPPRNVTFVFGHTHKPFQEDMSFLGYPQWSSIYNSGGWVVESVEAEPFHGGAVILADDNLDVVSLRMYNENRDPERYAMRIEEASHPGAQTNDLFKTITELINPSLDPWESFSDAAAEAVHTREQHLRAEAAEKG